MSEIPKISIGITTYNRPEFLREAIVSVLNQSFHDFEIVVSNDYLAVPVTWENLKIAEDSRVRLVNQMINLGELKNMNFLLHAVRGEWFMWLADDDLIHPEFLSKAIEVIRGASSRKMAAVYSNYMAAEDPLGVFPEYVKQGEIKYFNKLEFIEEYSSRNVPLVGTYGLMRTAMLREIGGIIPLGNSFSPYSDNLIPLMLVKLGDIAWLEEKFVFLRTHSESLSCKSTDVSAFTSAEDDFLIYFNHILTSVEFGINSERIRAKMITWFAHNELAVILRDAELTLWQKISTFIRYQLKHHLSRLPPKYKVLHIAFVVSLLIRELLLNLRLRLRRAV
jgi:glycosyltransferase involved in cell wall biosynthesis